MQGKLWISESKILDRQFHAHVFQSRIEPKGIILWFGAGKSKDKYEARKKWDNRIFDETWNKLGQDLPIIFVFVTGPYDIRIAKFSNFPEDLEKWNQHVEEEILGNFPDLPVYLIGNSGGAALALNGVHKLSNIVGAGCIGGDDIPEDLEIPLKKDGEPKWYLKLYYNLNDPVYNTNLDVIEKLGRRRLIEINRYEGIHNTGDYIRNRSVEGLIRVALRSFSSDYL